MSRRAIFAALLVAAATGCPRSEGDARRSSTQLEIAQAALKPAKPGTPPDTATAISASSRAIAYQPDNAEAYNVRGVAHLLDALSAKRLLEVEDCLHGLDAEAQQVEIDKHLMKAGADFRRATELAPDFGEAWFNLGNIQLTAQDYETAVNSYRTALEYPMRLIDPSMTRATLGSALFEMGDHVAAAVELRAALQFLPGMCLGRLWFGRVYFERKEWETAAEYLEEVVADPACRLQEAALYLMKTRLQQGLLDQAAAAKTACLSLNRSSCAAEACLAEGASL